MYIFITFYDNVLERQQLQEQTDKLNDKVEKLETALAGLSKAKDDEITDKNQLIAQLQSAYDTTEAELQLKNSELKNLKYDLEQKTPMDDEGKLSDDFSKKLALVLQEKEDEIEKLKMDHNARLEERLNDALTAFSKELEEEKKKKQDEIDALVNDLSAALQENAELKKNLNDKTADKEKNKETEDTLRKRLNDALDRLHDTEKKLRAQEKDLAGKDILQNVDLMKEILVCVQKKKKKFFFFF
ncbi:surface protein [Reticulomyxa filosa]|uniref:Surface protein n=1 Tax=Reticulomyxa filosa TaxID=46433 RepID=X6LIC6_RETFI|nr:surface protein [Reticulomyxa filosa]|eukprot:ETO00867.1 surface protein [Reticulomyxa filosa]